MTARHWSDCYDCCRKRLSIASCHVVPG